MKGFIIASCLLLSFAQVYSQRVCASEEYRQQFSNTSREILTTETTVPARDTVPNEIITIPVVVHVLYKTAEENISDEQILSQIKALNEDFRLLNADRSNIPQAFQNVAADSRIMFCLAKVDPNGRSTTGIVRKATSRANFMADDAMKFKSQGGADAWDSKRYLNIWVCRIFGRTMGYSSVPGSEASKDGVVITFNAFGTKGNVRGDFNKGRTATHEIAHWMGLKHIWGDDYCGDDGIDDTPQQKSYNFNCPSYPRLSNCSPGSAAGDMYMNFMDLTNDACMNLFTRGQKNKMRAAFALKGLRNSFLRSYQCDASLATGGPLPEDTIATAQAADAINVFPNPVNNVVQVRSKLVATLQGQTATILSASGKPLMQQVLKDNNASIYIGHLPAGLYMLSVGNSSHKTNFKLIKL